MNSRDIAAHTLLFHPKYKAEDQAPFILNGIRQAGYSCFEGFLDDAPHYGKYLRATETRMIAGHAATPRLLEPEKVLADLGAASCSDLCISGLLEWWGRSPDDYRAGARVLNEAGAKLRPHGVFLHYHNHDFEFERVEGERTGMDILAEELDFSAVSWCFDAGWAWLAGHDATAFMHRHAQRIGVLHLRDFDNRKSCALGQGQAPLEEMLRAARQLPNLRHAVVEQDAADDPIGELQTSRKYLLGAIEWDSA